MVATEYQHLIGALFFNILEVLVNSVGSSLVPVAALFFGQIWLKLSDYPVRGDKTPGCANANMFSKRERIVLGEDLNIADS